MQNYKCESYMGVHIICVYSVFFFIGSFTLPELTDEGYRVSICGLLDSDISKWSVTDFTVRSIMNFDVRLMEESCLGDVYIMDLSEFTFKHLSHYTIGFIKKCVLCQIVSETELNVPYIL